MYDDLVLEGETELAPTRAGTLPFVAIACGLAMMGLGHVILRA